MIFEWHCIDPDMMVDAMSVDGRICWKSEKMMARYSLYLNVPPVHPGEKSLCTVCACT